ncbi:hypothetical protein RB653_010537 [Dictyostelium firmibasis]|uniref:SEC7 domain-containing protein n=1 Tax=Dictyostelium firmibasis TaxID=79012 RepID=A0AAN7TZH1_9MYCE
MLSTQQTNDNNNNNTQPTPVPVTSPPPTTTTTTTTQQQQQQQQQQPTTPPTPTTIQTPTTPTTPTTAAPPTTVAPPNIIQPPTQQNNNGNNTPPSTPESLTILVNKYLNKTLSDCSKKQQSIKDEVKIILEYLKANPTLLTKNESFTSPSLRLNPQWTKFIDHLATIYKFAFESKSSKLIVSSVDFIEKLISGSYILSGMIDENNKIIVDKFIEPTLYHCADISDEMTLVQITKLVHTAASKFHRQTLLYSFKTLFYININSKPSSNLAIASKTSITQIINRTFKSFKTKPNNPNTTTPTKQPQQQLQNVSPPSSQPSNNSPIPISFTDLQSPPQTPNPNPTTPKEQVTDDSVNKPIDSQVPVPVPAPVVPSTVTTTATTTINNQEHELNLKDSIYLFRLLCDLSLKDISDYDSPEVKVRIFSLELISNIFDDYGRFIKHYPSFINYEIREGLFPSVLNSGFSSHSTIFRLSLTLFLSMVVHYRDYLRDPIGQYFTLIVLRVLESSTSTLQQRWMVLQVLARICENYQILVDFYINYDCNLSSKDIFQKTIENLSKIAQLIIQENKINDLKVKNAALECLTSLAKALSEGINLQKENLQLKLSQIPQDNKFIKQKEFKLLIEEGKRKFKMSPKRGVEFFYKIGATERDPAKCAKFLRETEGLDKVSLGIYISEREDFNIAVLNHYTELFNFSGFTLDGALRFYLSHFRLVGEAQKVDRLMEVFSKKYFDDNDATETGGTNIIVNKDSVFILAFATIMLATDLHSSSIKNHMSKQQWLKMNSKNNGGADYDEQFLLGIYDRISSEPLKLKEDDSPQVGSGDGSPDDFSIKIKNSFPIDDPPNKGQFQKLPFDHGNLLENLKFMMDVSWTPILAALSTVLENTEDPKIIQVCLEGFKYSNNLLCLLQMTMEREAFISSLSNFTISEKSKELKQKNMDSLQKLILIARIDGDHLEKSWLPVLKSISFLERLRVSYLGVEQQQQSSQQSNLQQQQQPNSQQQSNLQPNIQQQQSNIQQQQQSNIQQQLDGSSSNSSGTVNLNSSFSGIQIGNNSNNNTGNNTPTQSSLNTTIQLPPKRSISTTEFFLGVKTHQRSNSNLPSIEGINIDQVSKELETANHLFVNSTCLTNEAIVHFVDCLASVSIDELKLQSPSIFSLQKLVEVSYYNANRIKLFWSIIAEHFTKIGCTYPDNVYISSMVIDSLKQLAQKFLDFDEVEQEPSQKDFLKPLETIFSHNQHPEVRELILKCIFQLTNGRNSLIKSGWKPIFTIFTLSSSSNDSSIATQAFDFVDELIRDFSNISETFFIDYVNCLSSYANSRHKELPIKAIDILSYCGVQLANGRVCALVREEGTSANTPLFTDTQEHISLWFPLLTGLARVISHQDPTLRSYALDTLFRVLALFGSTFSSRLWELIFRGVLLPIFDNVGYSKGQHETILEDTRWLKQTGNDAFQSLTEMFINFVDIVCFLLDDMLDLLVSCILQENELLAKTAGTFLIQLVSTNGTKFSQLQWSNIVSQFYKIFQSNTPFEIFKLIEFEQNQNNNENINNNNNNNSNNNNDSLPNISGTGTLSKQQQQHLLLSLSKQQQQYLSSLTNNEKSHSAPISPILDSSNKSNNNNNVSQPSLNPLSQSKSDNEISLRSSSSLPTTPIVLTPPVIRKELNSINEEQSTTTTTNGNNIEQKNTIEQQNGSGEVISSSSNSSSVSHSRSNSDLPISTPIKSHSRLPSSSNINLSAFNQQYLINQSNNNNSNQNNQSQYTNTINNIQSKCSVQLQMVQAINDIAISHYEFLNTSQLFCLGDCLQLTFTFCQDALVEQRLISSLKKVGQTFDILKKKAITGYLNLLMILYSEKDVDVENRSVHSEFRLINLCQELIQIYISNPNETIVQSSTILQILQGILSFDDGKFLRNTSIFYELLIQLLVQENKEIRANLRDILIRIGKLQGTINK